ncbi:MAG: sigma-70 family RNA polymerase sigma factor [Fuerstiella sp.]
MHVHGIPIEIIQRLRQGEPTALADLFAVSRDRLRQMIHFRIDPRLNRRIDPDDVLQEAYLDAQKRIEHYQATPEESSAYVWLRLITLQTLADTHRRHLGTKGRDASREQPLPEASSANQTTAHSIANLLVSGLTSPSEAIQRAEAIEQVRVALEQMDPIDQEVLALRNFEELTNTETAEILKIAQGASSLRYIRALKRLQQVMSQFPESKRTW